MKKKEKKKNKSLSVSLSLSRVIILNISLKSMKNFFYFIVFKMYMKKKNN